MTTNFRRVVSASLVCTILGCSTMRDVPDPFRFLAEENPPIVYVGYVEEGVPFTREMQNPRLVGDTVLGTWTEGNRPAAVPKRNVHSIATVRRDGTRTALFVAAVAAAAGGFAYALFQKAATRSNWYCDFSDFGRGYTGEPYCGPINGDGRS